MKTIGIEKHHYSLPTQATFKSNGEQITYVQDTDFKREILKINRRIHLDLPRRECDEDNNQVTKSIDVLIFIVFTVFPA